MSKKIINEEFTQEIKERAKIIWVKWGLLIVGIAITVLAGVFSSYIFGENSIFRDNITENHFINSVWSFIPQIISSIQAVTLSYLALMAVDAIIKKCFRKTQRGKTISKMLMNFVWWVYLIVIILLILGILGIDTTAIVASAGVLTLVIGLGAQSLVADIVAGVFMVCEGTIEVGDIVIIDGWRGTVREVGIRTTKLVNASGDINYINNSKISSIINQTKELSLAKCTVSIEYSESIPKVEEILKSNMDSIREKIPAIVEGPFYKGVSELGASSVDLLIIAKCKEEDIFQVQRDLNREIKILFDENNINIPFPQIVLNYRDK